MRRQPFSILTISIAFTSLASAGASAVQSVAVAGTKFPVNLATQAGQPYDAQTIERDVRQLWSTGRFDDIRVEAAEGTEGAALVFRVREAQQKRLRDVHIEPHSFGLHPKIAAGTMIDPLHAHDIALEAKKRLNAEGYINARIDDTLVIVSPEKVDLRLTVHAGDTFDLKEVSFRGHPGLDVRELRGALHATRIRRVLPPVPGVWGGWRLFPAYNPEAVDSDLARLRSLYFSKGYFDANVLLDDTELHRSAAKLSIFVEAGPRYEANVEALCSCLLATRRATQREGVLDFSAALDVRRLPEQPNATLAASVEAGHSYRVGRIDFNGNHRYSDSTVRRNLLLDESQPLDRQLLLKSIARLNRTAWFEPLDAKSVAIHPNDTTGLADVTLHLAERQRRAWSISGPVGPMSISGPFQASLSSRLPPWGQGLLELSTYTASLSLIAFPHALVPILALSSKRQVLPVLSLSRPFAPGEGWRSGFTVAPQIGWQRSALGYAITQMQQRLLPTLAGNRGLDEELPVTVHRPQGEMVLNCAPHKPRFEGLRMGAVLMVRLLGTLSAI
jgi:outer membrane protein assembly factor BamA